MKPLFLVASLAVLLTIVSFAAIKNENSDKPFKVELGGQWQGSYSVDEGPFVNPLIFEFRANQKLDVCYGPKEWGDRATGKYSLEGEKFTARYKFSEGIQNAVLIKAILQGDKIEGTWEWVKGKGKFQMLKKGL